MKKWGFAQPPLSSPSSVPSHKSPWKDSIGFSSWTRMCSGKDHLHIHDICVWERDSFHPVESLHFSDQEWGRKKQKEGGRQIGTVRNKERGREKKAKLRERAQPSNSSPSPQHDCRAVRLGIKTLASLHPTQTAALQKHSASHSYIHMTASIPHQEKKTFKQTPKLERQREQTQKAHRSV